MGNWLSHTSSYSLGLLFILIVAIIWAGASVFVQYIYEDLNFESPFLVTYISSSLFAVYLPLWQLWIYLGFIDSPPKFSNISSTSGDGTEYSLASNNSSEDSLHSAVGDNALISADALKSELVSKSYSHMDVIKIAAFIAPLWFGSNFLYYCSLSMTTVSSSTIISNLSASFALIFARFCGLEDVTIGKILGLLVCFGGVSMVALSDSEGSSELQSDRDIRGDVVALLAAMGYGIYTTAIRRKVPDDNSISMQLLLGYIGLFNFLLFLPVLLILIFLKLDETANASPKILGFIIVTGLCDDVVSDYLWARAVLLTSPTIATVGMSITIPLAILSDLLLGNASPTVLSGTGAALVILGFVFVNTENVWWKRNCKYCMSLLGIQDHEELLEETEATSMPFH